MKKIISISVIALFAMIPTFGWAAFDGVQSGSRDPHVNQTVPENTSTTTYVTTRSGATDNGLSGDHGFQRAGAGVESIVTSQDPKFNVTQITEKDGTDVAALSFVKGAYNDAITKINKVYDLKAETSGKFKLNTTWDGAGAEKVTLITVNQDFVDPKCPYGFKNGSKDQSIECASEYLEVCVRNGVVVTKGDTYVGGGDEPLVKGWSSLYPQEDGQLGKACFYANEVRAGKIATVIHIKWDD